MSPQSLPAVILASIVIFIGFHNLGMFLRKRDYKTPLTFFFTCLTIGFYDISAAFLYSAPSWVEGAPWQRLQFVATALICGIIPWFLYGFFHDVLPVSRRMRRVTAFLTGFFVLAAVGVIANPGGLFWLAHTPLVKTIRLPLGITVVYNEVALGPLIDVINLFVFLLVLVLAFLIIRQALRGPRQGLLPLAVVTVLILACLLNDTLVTRGLLPFVYTIEYALMGLAMLITRSHSRQVVEAGRVQEALQESEARYRNIFQHAAVSLLEGDIRGVRAGIAGLGLRDGDGLQARLRDRPDLLREAIGRFRVTEVNDALVRLFGARKSEDLLGDLCHLVQADTLAQFHDSILAIASGRDGFEREAKIHTLQGKQLDVIVSVRLPREVGDGNRMLISITDITARKSAEEKLKAFIAQSTEAIFLVDETGRIAEFNPSTERMVGIPRDGAIGMPVWDLLARTVPEDRRTPDYARRMEARFREALSTGTGDFLRRPIEGILQRPDGSSRDFIQFLFPIRTEGGFLLGSISHDTTEARATQEALRLSEERLRQAQKMEAIGTLAGGIAHDFNNLLTGILGYSSVLREELPAGSRAAADVEAIESSARRAAELTQQILTFSRQDSRIEMRPLDPNAAVREVVRLLERTVDKSISVRTDLSREPLRIRGNAGQIHQAVLNLCLNARDAMPLGGKLTIETDRTADRVVLSVTDTGIGMTEEQKARMYEPFYTTKEHGRGLGLSMVYGIVRGHGGEITVHSAPGEGTTFRILLPATVEPLHDAVMDAPSARGGAETILVIDDEEPVRRVAARILTKAGYAVIQAEDGARGLAAFGARRGAVHLVVLDVSMPGMGGAEVHERLLALDPAVKVILSSGYSDDGRVSGILAKGVRAFLPKPYTAAEVLRTVREALDG